MNCKSLLTSLWAVAAVLAAAQTRYMITDAGADFDTSGINDSCLMTSGLPSYAWDPVNGLVVIPGFNESGSYSWALGVNDGGLVVGYAYHSDGSQSAILWDRINGTRLLADFGGYNSQALGINDLGHVVGGYFTNTAEAAFIWKSGTGVSTLYDPGLAAGALKVNVHEQVLGEVEMVQNQQPVAVVWQPDGSVTFLGNMGSQYENEPYDINDSGAVCGISFGPMGEIGYLRDAAGNYTPIYNPLSQSDATPAVHLNNSNQVVGESVDASGHYAGFVWSPQAGFTLLNDVLAPGSTQWSIQRAESINDYGQIGAVAYLNGVEHGVLLSPIPQNVVIPDSYSLFRGTLASGVLYCLQFQDALYLAVHPGKTITAAEPPVQVEIKGTSPTISPKSFQFTFTGHVNTPHLTEGILLYNFQTGTYELLNAQAATLSDSTVTVSPTGDLTRFVNPATKEVRARVTFIPNGQIVFAAWTASLGLTDWTIQ